MNRFDQLMARGMAKATAIVGQTVSIGPVSKVAANASPIERQQRYGSDGSLVWVDAGEIAIGRDAWPDNQPDPTSGQIIILEDGSRFRVERTKGTAAILTVSFTSEF